MVGINRSPMDAPNLLDLPPPPPQNSLVNSASGAAPPILADGVIYTKINDIKPTSRRINLVLRVVSRQALVQCGGTDTVPLAEIVELRAGDETGTATFLISHKQATACGNIGETIVVRNANVFILENQLYLEVDETFGHIAKAPAQALFSANTRFDLSRVKFHLIHTA